MYLGAYALNALIMGFMITFNVKATDSFSTDNPLLAYFYQCIPGLMMAFALIYAILALRELDTSSDSAEPAPTEMKSQTAEDMFLLAFGLLSNLMFNILKFDYLSDALMSMGIMPDSPSSSKLMFLIGFIVGSSAILNSFLIYKAWKQYRSLNHSLMFAAV